LYNIVLTSTKTVSNSDTGRCLAAGVSQGMQFPC